MIKKITGVLVTAVTPLSSALQAPIEQPVQWTRGEDGYVEIVVYKIDGTKLNLAGCSLSMGIRHRDASKNALLTRAGTLTDSSNGKAAFPLVAEDSAGWAIATLRMDVWLVLPDASRHQIVLSSDFQLLPEDTRTTELPSNAAPIPPVTNGNVADLATLALVDTSLIGPGFMIYVVDHDAYYRLRVGLGLAVDGETCLAALGLAGAQWVRGLGS